MSQKADPSPSEPIIWDYHVVLLEESPEGWLVWDLDTTLNIPVPVFLYLTRTFPVLPEDLQEFSPRFRVVEAEDYYRLLRTDRRHMRSGEGWFSPPPPWPVIGEGSNLEEFLNMDTPFVGRVLELEEMFTEFA